MAPGASQGEAEAEPVGKNKEANMWVSKTKWQKLLDRMWTLEQQLNMRVHYGRSDICCYTKAVPLNEFIESLLQYLGIEAEYISQIPSKVGFNKKADQKQE
jgi:hypothetical protein